MGKKSKRAKQERDARKFQGPKETNGETPVPEESTSGENSIPGSDWKRAEIAYNDEGNIIILDPVVAARVRKGARADRELEIGIPREPVDFDPDPEPEPLGAVRAVYEKLKRNELCVCDVMRFRLELEGPVDHKLLSTEPRA